MKFSVVTPSFNQAPFIEECLWSVKSQNHPAIEHIVVDGGSTDGTVALLRQYSAKPDWKHLTWTSEPDRGQADAINKGFARATGEIFAYLCADDTYLRSAFSLVHEHFTLSRNADLIYGSCVFTDQSGRPLRLKRAVAFDRRMLLRHNIIWQPTVFFRSQVWEQTGPFSESLNYAMDYEYWLRASQTCRIQSVDAQLATYRWQLDSKTVAHEREQLQEAYEVARNFGGGGFRSWYLHRIYWPRTSRLKRRIFGWLTSASATFGSKSLPADFPQSY